MRQKKNNKIMLTVIIFLTMLILLVGIAFAYFSTDMFKSNKELFFYYITQMGKEKEGFIESSLKNYFEKQENTPYINQGNIQLFTNQQQSESTNNMQISFNGQFDKKNKQSIQNISLNYSEKVKFPFTFKHIGETIGVQTDYIGSKYIAVNSNNTGLVTGGMEERKKIQELAHVNLSKEEWQKIENTYMNVLDKQLSNSNFSKIEEEGNKGYQLTIKGDQFKNILINMLETLKNDQMMLDKINEYRIKTQRNATQITTRDIEDLREKLSHYSELNEVNLEISVYQQKQRTKKIVIKINQIQIQVEKNVTGNDQQYNMAWEINQEDIHVKINFMANYSGLQSLQSISENYELMIQCEGQSQVNTILQKAKNSQSSLNLAEEMEQIQLLIEYVKIDKIAQADKADFTKEDFEKSNVNKENIKIGEENGKIILTMIDTGHKFKIDGQGKIIEKPELESDSENSSHTNQNTLVTYQYNANNNVEFTDNVHIEKFSNDDSIVLEELEEEQRNTLIKAILERIQSVNKNQMEKLGLNENENPLQKAIPQINVLFSKKETNQTNLSEVEISAFNMKFEAYEGNLKGVTVKGLLSTIQRNNESDEKGEGTKIKEIHFDGEEYEATSQNITFIKGSIETETVYRVEFERDENTGMIYRAVINKK